MNKETGSATAFGAATLRAAHQLIDGEHKLLEDPIILQLLGYETRDYILNNKERFFHPYATGMRTHIALRSRYAEDCLYHAYKNGIRQYVLLGAGLDTFAHRQRAWAKDLKIIEADHPASRKAKLEKLQLANIPIPENVIYTQIDFEKDDLTQIFSGVLNFEEPAFVSCLGVLVYLTKKAIDNIFQFVGSLPAQTEFVFTARQNNDPSYIATRAAEAGEPWISHFTPDELRKKLEGHRFSKIHFLTPEEIKHLYFDRDAIQLAPPARSSIVKATV